MRPLYMEVTRDRLELPLAVADSPWELAQMRGVTVYPILHAIEPTAKETKRRKKYIKVWVDDEEKR